MKKVILAMLAVLTAGVDANALSVKRSREEARFLTDKMCYELNLTDAQADDVYEINYDYFRALGPVDAYYDSYFDRRYQELSYVLYDWQWDEFLAREYFLRPAYIYRGGWAFGIYNYYARTHFFYGIPRLYYSYAGIHYGHPHYYRDRFDMHRKAVIRMGRPANLHRPHMTRPNVPRAGSRSAFPSGNEKRGNALDSRPDMSRGENPFPSGRMNRGENSPADRRIGRGENTSTDRRMSRGENSSADRRMNRGESPSTNRRMGRGESSSTDRRMSRGESSSPSGKMSRDRNVGSDRKSGGRATRSSAGSPQRSSTQTRSEGKSSRSKDGSHNSSDSHRNRR